MPVLGHVPGWKRGWPPTPRTMRATAAALVGIPSPSGCRSSTVTVPPSVACKPTFEPWHCWQPENALASPLTGAEPRPGVGPCGSNGTREPSTVSARKLSSDARMLPPAAWWLVANSAASAAWQRAQSRGVTTVAMSAP